jgi:hypothetical protein
MHSVFGTRLLSIGEIFDRAINLTVANLLPLVAIIALVDVPIRAIADWLDRGDLSRTFGAAGIIMKDPRQIANFFTLSRDPNAHAFNWFSLLWIVVSVIPLSFGTAAASIASQEFLMGGRPGFRTAYRSAIRRLGPVVGATILALATYLFAIVAAIIAVYVSLFVWLMILKAAHGVTNSLSLVGVTAMLFVVFAAAIMWIIPLANCTTTGAALYAIRPIRAFREAWAMTMVRGRRWRSLAFGAALIALALVQEFIWLAVCGFLSDVTHSTWLAFVASDAITLLGLIIGMALAVVFYLDARNRTALIQDPLAKRENSQSQ